MAKEITVHTADEATGSLSSENNRRAFQKLMDAWRSKNAESARRVGTFSFMAATLTACVDGSGSNSSTAEEETPFSVDTSDPGKATVSGEFVFITTEESSVVSSTELKSASNPAVFSSSNSVAILTPASIVDGSQALGLVDYQFDLGAGKSIDGASALVLTDGVTVVGKIAEFDLNAAGVKASGDGNVWLLIGKEGAPSAEHRALLDIRLDGGDLTFDMPSDDDVLTLEAGTVIDLGGGTLIVSDGKVMANAADVELLNIGDVIVNSELVITYDQFMEKSENPDFTVTGTGVVTVLVEDDVQAASFFDAVSKNPAVLGENAPEVRLENTSLGVVTEVDLANLVDSKLVFLSSSLEKQISNLDADLQGQIDLNVSKIVEVAGDLAALRGVVTTLQGTVADNKTELQGNIDQVQDNLEEAIGSLTSTLNGEVSRLEGVIASGDQTNADSIAEVATDLATLQGVVNNLNDTYATDAEVSEAVGAAQTALQSAIDTLSGTVTSEVSRLETAIADGDQTNADSIAGVATDLATLQGVVNNLSDTYATDAEVSEAVAVAQSALQSAIDTLSGTVTGEVSRLETAIADGDQTNADSIAGVATDLATLQGVVNNLNDTYATDAEVSEAVAVAQSALQNAIDTLSDTVTGEVSRLETAMAAGDQTNADSIAGVATDLATLQGVVNNLNDTYATDAEVSEAVAVAQSALQNAIDTLSDTVTSEVSRLEGEIVSLREDVAGEGFDPETDLSSFAAISDTIQNLSTLVGSDALADGESDLISRIADLETAIGGPARTVTENIDVTNGVFSVSVDSEFDVSVDNVALDAQGFAQKFVLASLTIESTEAQAESDVSGTVSASATAYLDHFKDIPAEAELRNGDYSVTVVVNGEPSTVLISSPELSPKGNIPYTLQSFVDELDNRLDGLVDVQLVESATNTGEIEFTSSAPAEAGQTLTVESFSLEFLASSLPADFDVSTVSEGLLTYVPNPDDGVITDLDSVVVTASRDEQASGLYLDIETSITAAVSALEKKLLGDNFDPDQDYATLESLSDAVNGLVALADGDFSGLLEKVGNPAEDGNPASGLYAKIESLQSQIDNIVKPDLIQRNELDNRVELDEYESTAIRVELGEGNDFLNSSDAETEIVGGRGADTINLTYNDTSKDTVVYQTVEDGRVLPTTTVSYSTDASDYRESSELNITINGKEYSYTVRSDDGDTVIPETVDDIGDSLIANELEQFANYLAERTVQDPANTLVGFTGSSYAIGEGGMNGIVTRADLDDDGAYTVPAGKMFVSANDLLAYQVGNSDTDSDISDYFGLLSVIKSGGERFYADQGALFNLKGLRSAFEGPDSGDNPLFGDIVGTDVGLDALTQVTLSQELVEEIVELAYLADVYNVGAMADQPSDPDASQLTEARAFAANYSDQLLIGEGGALSGVSVEGNLLTFYGQAGEPLKVEAGGDNKAAIVNNGLVTRVDISFSDQVDDWPTPTNGDNTTVFDRQLRVTIDGEEVVADVVYASDGKPDPAESVKALAKNIDLAAGQGGVLEGVIADTTVIGTKLTLIGAKVPEADVDAPAFSVDSAAIDQNGVQQETVVNFSTDPQDYYEGGILTLTVAGEAVMAPMVAGDPQSSVAGLLSELEKQLDQSIIERVEQFSVLPPSLYKFELAGSLLRDDESLTYEEAAVNSTKGGVDSDGDGNLNDENGFLAIPTPATSPVYIPEDFKLTDGFNAPLQVGDVSETNYLRVVYKSTKEATVSGPGGKDYIYYSSPDEFISDVLGGPKYYNLSAFSDDTIKEALNGQVVSEPAHVRIGRLVDGKEKAFDFVENQEWYANLFDVDGNVNGFDGYHSRFGSDYIKMPASNGFVISPLNGSNFDELLLENVQTSLRLKAAQELPDPLQVSAKLSYEGEYQQATFSLGDATNYMAFTDGTDLTGTTRGAEVYYDGGMVRVSLARLDEQGSPIEEEVLNVVVEMAVVEPKTVFVFEGDDYDWNGLATADQVSLSVKVGLTTYFGLTSFDQIISVLENNLESEVEFDGGNNELTVVPPVGTKSVAFYGSVDGMTFGDTEVQGQLLTSVELTSQALVDALNEKAEASDFLKDASFDAGTGQITLTAAQPGKQTFEISDVTLDYQGVKQLATFSLDGASEYIELSDGTSTNRGSDVYFEGGKAFLTIIEGADAVADGATPASATVSVDMVPNTPVLEVPRVPETWTSATEMTFTDDDWLNISFRDANDKKILTFRTAEKDTSGTETLGDFLARMETHPWIESVTFESWSSDMEQGSFVWVLADGSPITEAYVSGDAGDTTAYNSRYDVESVSGAAATSQALVDEINTQINGGQTSANPDPVLSNLLESAAYDPNTGEITLTSKGTGNDLFQIADVSLDYQGVKQISTAAFSTDDSDYYVGGEVRLTVDTTPQEDGGDVGIVAEMADTASGTFRNLLSELQKAIDPAVEAKDAGSGALNGIVGSASIDQQGVLTLISQETEREAFTINDAELTVEPVKQLATVDFSVDDADYIDGGSIGLKINDEPVSVDMVSQGAAATLEALESAIQSKIDDGTLTKLGSVALDKQTGTLTLTAKDFADGYGEIDISEVFADRPAQVQVTELDLSGVDFEDARLSSDGELPQVSVSVAGYTITAEAGADDSATIDNLVQAIVEARDGVRLGATVTSQQSEGSLLLSASTELTSETLLSPDPVKGELSVFALGVDQVVPFNFIHDGATVGDFVAYINNSEGGLAAFQAEIMSGDIVISNSPGNPVSGDVTFNILAGDFTEEPVTAVADSATGSDESLASLTLESFAGLSAGASLAPATYSLPLILGSGPASPVEYIANDASTLNDFIDAINNTDGVSATLTADGIVIAADDATTTLATGAFSITVGGTSISQAAIDTVSGSDATAAIVVVEEFAGARGDQLVKAGDFTVDYTLNGATQASQAVVAVTEGDTLDQVVADMNSQLTGVTASLTTEGLVLSTDATGADVSLSVENLSLTLLASPVTAVAEALGSVEYEADTGHLTLTARKAGSDPIEVSGVSHEVEEPASSVAQEAGIFFYGDATMDGLAEGSEVRVTLAGNELVYKVSAADVGAENPSLSIAEGVFDLLASDSRGLVDGDKSTFSDVDLSTSSASELTIVASLTGPDVLGNVDNGEFGVSVFRNTGTASEPVLQQATVAAVSESKSGVLNFTTETGGMVRDDTGEGGAQTGLDAGRLTYDGTDFTYTVDGQDVLDQLATDPDTSLLDLNDQAQEGVAENTTEDQTVVNPEDDNSFYGDSDSVAFTPFGADVTSGGAIEFNVVNAEKSDSVAQFYATVSFVADGKVVSFDADIWPGMYANYSDGVRQESTVQRNDLLNGAKTVSELAQVVDALLSAYETDIGRELGSFSYDVATNTARWQAADGIEVAPRNGDSDVFFRLVHVTDGNATFTDLKSDGTGSVESNGVDSAVQFNARFVGDGVTQTFTNPENGFDSGQDGSLDLAGAPSEQAGNADFTGDAERTGSEGVSQSHTNPDSGYDALDQSPAGNANNANVGDETLYGSDPGQYVEDGLETEFLAGGTDVGGDGVYESRNGEDLSGKVGTGDGSATDDGGLAGESAGEFTDGDAGDDGFEVTIDDKGFAAFDWDEATVTVLDEGNAGADLVRNFQTANDVIGLEGLEGLEGGLVASTVSGDLDAVVVTEPQFLPRALNTSLADMSLSDHEFGLVSSEANGLAMQSVSAADIEDAKAVSELLEEVYRFDSELFGTQESTDINTTLFAVTAADDPDLTSIWVHTQSDANDTTVEEFELNLLATVESEGDAFSVQNFAIEVDDSWQSPVILQSEQV